MAGRDDLKEWFGAALGDPEAQERRRAAIDSSLEFLRELAGRLWIRGELGSAADQGVSVLAQIAAELAESAALLLAQDHTYGSAVLIRQLVEVEYLAWTFAEEPASAARWMNSSPADVRKLFQPKDLRRRSGGRFRDAEYWQHCNQGGHPHPRALHLLRYREVPFDSVEALRADLCQHTVRVLREIERAVRHQGLEQGIPVELLEAAHTAVAAWKEGDAISDLPPPPQ